MNWPRFSLPLSCAKLAGGKEFCPRGDFSIVMGVQAGESRLNSLDKHERSLP
jgi:hypothetical protein